MVKKIIKTLFLIFLIKKIKIKEMLQNMLEGKNSFFFSRNEAEESGDSKTHTHKTLECLCGSVS